jgi:hypothetical protein
MRVAKERRYLRGTRTWRRSDIARFWESVARQWMYLRRSPLSADLNEGLEIGELQAGNGRHHHSLAFRREPAFSIWEAPF